METLLVKLELQVVQVGVVVILNHQEMELEVQEQLLQVWLQVVTYQIFQMRLKNMMVPLGQQEEIILLQNTML